MILTLLGGFLAVVGTGFMVVAAVGIARFPDIYARLHCAGKSATLGVACLLAAAAVWSADPGLALRAALASVFFLITGPVGCHALARAVWRNRERAG